MKEFPASGKTESTGNDTANDTGSHGVTGAWQTNGQKHFI
ncbi:hypothetical protein QFZ51_001766 [Chitinophaga sp. W3I9]